MYQLLKKGQIVRGVRSAEDCVIEQYLGGGGQGEVYRGVWNGQSCAIKWYFKNTATAAQRSALEVLVEGHSPGDRFLWPLDLAIPKSGDGFGYIMKLRDPRFRGLIDLIARRIDPKFTALVRAGSELADGFRTLHLRGYCYRDISWGNAFLDPATGEVLICDNDNVAPNKTTHTEVLGTPDFMAPEVVRGEALPSRQTDLHSLAVLLFYMFFGCHPLMGKRVLTIRCWDTPARQKLFGNEPLFIFDARDDSNCAVSRKKDPIGEAGANALDNWPIYPDFFKRLFLRAFGAGLSDSENGRVGANEWRKVLGKLRDSVYYCKCGAENFFDPDSRSSAKCWSCGQSTKPPMKLRLSDGVVMLNHDSQLFYHHVSAAVDLDYSSPLGQVVPHPTQAGTWGLKNLSKSNWVITVAGGPPKDVPSGRSVVLAPATRIQIDRAIAEVE